MEHAELLRHCSLEFYRFLSENYTQFVGMISDVDGPLRGDALNLLSQVSVEKLRSVFEQSVMRKLTAGPISLRLLNNWGRLGSHGSELAKDGVRVG